jgi:peptidoglycan/LPS O-acetylase OafA/YrhL
LAGPPGKPQTIAAFHSFIKHSIMQKTFVYFSYFMVVVFMICGIVVMVYPPDSMRYPVWLRFVGGSILILYAVFRWQRVHYLKRKHRDNNEQ